MVVARGGPQTRVNSSVQVECHGQVVGRCRMRRRAVEAILAGTVISLRRIVTVVAFARVSPARVAAARVRLNAMTACTSQAALAQKCPEGRWARAEFCKRLRPAVQFPGKQLWHSPIT